jgi:hypothetical protein
VPFGKLRSFFKVNVTTGDQSFATGGDPGFDELKRVLEAHGIDPEKGGTLELTGEKAEALKRDIETALGSGGPAQAEPVVPPAVLPAPPDPATAGSLDPVDRLVRLSQLRREGALSEAEFEAAKRKVLEDL